MKKMKMGKGKKGKMPDIPMVNKGPKVKGGKISPAKKAKFKRFK